MLRHLEEIIKQYEPKQQETLRHYALKMNETAKRGNLDNYLTYGLIFMSLCNSYWAQNQVKKVTK